MAKPAKNTFGAMKASLQSLGFVASRHGANIVFAYPGGSPIILLPAYKSGDVVRPIHRMMVKKQLTDAGMIRPEPAAIVAQAKAERGSITEKRSGAVRSNGS